MDFSGKLFLAAIHEDNTQRALFRVRPLLSEEGNVSPEDLEELIDEGYLRVVPDKGEQHTFKERMRGLGQLCLINLKNVSSDFSKVRLNKNYAPTRGENNRYVIYSDAITGFNGIDIFEVVSDPKAVKPSTDLYYLRKGGHIQGPYDITSGEAIDLLSCIAPDNHRLFSVPMSDEKEKLYYWPLSNSIAAAEKCEEKEEANPAGLLNGLQEESSQNQTIIAKQHTEEIQVSLKPNLEIHSQEQTLPEHDFAKDQPKKMIANPIKHAAQRPLNARSDYLTLHSIVDHAVRHGRPDEPSLSLSKAGTLLAAENPAEQFRMVLQQLWQHPATRQQATRDLLAMPGAMQALGEEAGSKSTNIMLSIFKQQLNSLEAERLASLMELEHIRDNKTSLIKAALKEDDVHTQALKAQQTLLEEGVRALREQCSKLSMERDELLKASTNALQTKRYAAASLGVHCSFDKAVKLIAETLEKAGFKLTKNDVVSLFIMVLLFTEINLVSDDLLDAKYALKLMAGAIGASIAADVNKVQTVFLPWGDAQVFAVFNENKDSFNLDHHYGHITWLTFQQDRWPSAFLPVSAGFAINEPSPSGVVVNAGLLKEYLQGVSRELSPEVFKILEKAQFVLGRPFPLQLRQEIITYLMCAQSLLEGGIASALDYSFAGFIIPFSKKYNLDLEPLRLLCNAMPKAASLL